MTEAAPEAKRRSGEAARLSAHDIADGSPIAERACRRHSQAARQSVRVSRG